MPVRDVMMVAGWSFRPPRKTQILFFLFLLAFEHFFLFVNSFRFCNLWLWVITSRRCCCLLLRFGFKSHWSVTPLKNASTYCSPFFFLFSFSPVSLLFCLVFFMLRTGNDHFRLWWNVIAAHGYCCLFSQKSTGLREREVGTFLFYYNLRLRWWKRSALTSFHSIQRPPLSPCFAQFFFIC